MRRVSQEQKTASCLLLHPRGRSFLRPVLWKVYQREQLKLSFRVKEVLPGGCLKTENAELTLVFQLFQYLGCPDTDLFDLVPHGSDGYLAPGVFLLPGL